jgi:hypothetical protein
MGPGEEARSKSVNWFQHEDTQTPNPENPQVYTVHKLAFGKNKDREASIIILDCRYHKTPYASWPMRLQVICLFHFHRICMPSPRRLYL